MDRVDSYEEIRTGKEWLYSGDRYIAELSLFSTASAMEGRWYAFFISHELKAISPKDVREERVEPEHVCVVAFQAELQAAWPMRSLFCTTMRTVSTGDDGRKSLVDEFGD